MSWWLPSAVFAILGLLIAAMPWNRPHPNQLFILEMLERLAEEEPDAESGNPGKTAIDNDKDGMRYCAYLDAGR